MKDAIIRALDWLEENPDKHIADSYALTKDGYVCDPNEPEADCFCVVGRIAHELGQEIFETEDQMGDHNLSAAEIEDMQDQLIEKGLKAEAIGSVKFMVNLSYKEIDNGI